jgi:hypothetical protein
MPGNRLAGIRLAGIRLAGIRLAGIRLAGNRLAQGASTGVRWRFWQSPDDQPGWARPALLGVAALAGFGYGWASHRYVTASVTAVVRGLGPFDTPFESYRVSTITQALPRSEAQFSAHIQQIAASTRSRYLFGVSTSVLAAPAILFSGDEVLPIGGFFGGGPAPTLATLRSDISKGYVTVFQLPLTPPSPDPRVQWLERHCQLMSEGQPHNGVQFATCG